MTPEQVFSIVNVIATAAWIALVILPGRRWVTGIVTSTAVPLLFASVYVGIVATTFGRTPGGFTTLAGVTARFYADRREAPCEFRDHDTEERLWRICEDFVSRTPR